MGNNNKNPISIDTVRSKTISGDRKIKGKRISLFDYLRVQTQNPGVGFLSTLFILLIVLLGIPIYPKVASAVELNEQKKVRFEEKLMPRALAIPVNMLPYLRFQHMAMKKGKYASWHQPVFRSGSCDQKNLTTRDSDEPCGYHYKNIKKEQTITILFDYNVHKLADL